MTKPTKPSPPERVIINDPPPDAVVDLFLALKAVLSAPKKVKPRARRKVKR